MIVGDQRVSARKPSVCFRNFLFPVHLSVVSYAMEAAMAEADASNSGANLIRRWVQIWIDDCNEFRRWEREELILKQPSPEAVLQHEKKSQLFILTARFLQGLMANPDYPARDLRVEVDGKVRQLEENWDMIHNPMSDSEASAILQKAFPNGPRIGSPA
jgi:hypothetical protein